MPKKCEVLIIGGGIAGSTCATVLDKSGIDNIYVIERAKNIGLSHSKKIDFAEDKGLKKLLNKYNLPIFKETNISRWFAPNQEMFEFKSKINDIWFKRGDKNSFETTVLKTTNVNTITNTEVAQITNGIVKTVNQKTKEKVSYKPRHIVIATGNSPPYFNRDKQESIIQMFTTRGFVVDQIDIEPDIPYVFFDKSYFESSYMYMVQHSEEDVGYIAYGALKDTDLVFDDLKQNKQFGAVISRSTAIDQIHGTIYVGKPCSLTYDNLLFVGDAANLIDPLFSYGIANAVKSGIFAAEAIVNEKNIAENYMMTVKNEIFRELHQHLKLRKLLNSLNNKDINYLIKLLNDIDENEDINELFDNMGKLSIKLVPRLVKDFRLLSIIFKGVRCLI